MDRNVVSGTQYISNEARGRVRALVAALETDAQTLEAAFKTIPPKALRCDQWKGEIGSQRNIARITAAMPRAPDLRAKRMVAWRYLKPVDELPKPIGVDEPSRPGVVLHAIIFGHRMMPAFPRSFGLAATLHALGRCYDRSSFAVDPGEAMLQAQVALLNFATPEGTKLFGLRRITLPTEGGAFLATPCRVPHDDEPLAICRTWIALDQAHPDQEADLAQWGRFLESGDWKPA
jgi:hypothetical protein